MFQTLANLNLSVATVAIGIAVLVVSILAGTILLAVLFRTVVPTEMVHVVQRRSATVSYGSKQAEGNVYYHWPQWVPFFGIVSKPVSVEVLSVLLKDYDGYDVNRLPFDVDVIAFLQVQDTAKAAVRMQSDPRKFMEQLHDVVRGCIRTSLARHDINVIMGDRKKIADEFTEEVKESFASWGIVPVKNVELLDIRDRRGSAVIANIMAKASSKIESESRIEVAKNGQAAKTREIEAQREVDTRAQEAAKQVGQATADSKRQVGIADAEARAAIATSQAQTNEKDIAAGLVTQRGLAENAKAAALVLAEQERRQVEIKAEAALNAAKLHAEGVKAQGEAEGAAEFAKLMAPVKSQIELMEKSGQNGPYLQYLAVIKGIEAQMNVGTAQARALEGADVKVIANGGNPTEGMTSAMELFSANGGTQLAAALEALGQTDQGKTLLNSVNSILSGKKE